MLIKRLKQQSYQSQYQCQGLHKSGSEKAPDQHSHSGHTYSHPSPSQLCSIGPAPSNAATVPNSPQTTKPKNNKNNHLTELKNKIHHCLSILKQTKQICRDALPCFAIWRWPEYNPGGAGGAALQI